MPNPDYLRIVRPPSNVSATESAADREKLEYPPFGEQKILKEAGRLILIGLNGEEARAPRLKEDGQYKSEKAEFIGALQSDPVDARLLGEKYAALHDTVVLILAEQGHSTAYMPATFAGKVQRTYRESYIAYYNGAVEGAAGLIVLGQLEGGIKAVTTRWREDVRAKALRVIKGVPIVEEGELIDGARILRRRTDDSILEMLTVSEERLEELEASRCTDQIVVKLVRAARDHVLSLEKDTVSVGGLTLAQRAERIARVTHTSEENIPAHKDLQPSRDEKS